LIKPVQNRTALLEALDRVRRAGAEPVTNWFATHRIDYWIASNSLALLQGERALLILRRDSGFQRVYHFAADLEALSAVLRYSSREFAASGVLITDLIGRPPDVDSAALVYRESGFVDHNCLVRMIRMAAPEEVAESEPDVEFAEATDVAAVADFLGSLLDPYTDQIPDENEIREASARRNIILVRRSESVSGLILFETTGLTSHLRYWYVDRSARNQRIGARLIRQYFRQCIGCKRIILWVVSGNSDAISKYCHYGFRQDTLVDRIMIRRG
jgi:GNAT superfamily N-acetyltransferase